MKIDLIIYLLLVLLWVWHVVTKVIQESQAKKQAKRSRMNAPMDEQPEARVAPVERGAANPPTPATRAQAGGGEMTMAERIERARAQARAQSGSPTGTPASASTPQRTGRPVQGGRNNPPRPVTRQPTRQQQRRQRAQQAQRAPQPPRQPEAPPVPRRPRRIEEPVLEVARPVVVPEPAGKPQPVMQAQTAKRTTKRMRFDAKRIREAIVMKELLDPPIALRQNESGQTQ